MTMTTLLLGRICRTCLLESSTMHKLLDIKRDHLQIEEILFQTVPSFDLKMDMEATPLPVEICNDCWEKLQLSYEFHQLCMSSNERLKHFLKENVDLGHQDQPNDIDQKDESYESVQALQETFKIEIGEELVTETYQIKHIDDKNDDNYYGEDLHHDDMDTNSESHLPTDMPDLKTKTRKYKKTISCPHCDKIFAKRMFLTHHLSVHLPEHQFVCDICHYRFATDKLLKIHISFKHKSGVAISLTGGPYECPDCPMRFQETRALAAHRVMHLERDFKCKICGVKLKTLAAVTRHMNCKHPGVLPYKCEMGEKAFPEETQHNDHINMHKDCKEHKCDMCDKGFPNPAALSDHMRSHTGESQHICSHCGKFFKTANILWHHLQRHGEKNLQCPECPMRFYVKDNLRKHMRTHTKEKPFVCDVCSSSFTRGDSLKAHKFKHSGQRPYKCEECNMSFALKYSLMKHKKTHTREKPHMCTHCDRSYANSDGLIRHLRTHLGENTYGCDECLETFKYQHELREHKNQHYKEKSEEDGSQKKKLKPKKI